MNRFVFLCLISILQSGALVWAVSGKLILKVEAVERGYAVLCPADRTWAWVGECDK